MNIDDSKRAEPADPADSAKDVAAGVQDPPGYELVDAGVGRRLERFGERLVDRPAPMATGWRAAPDAWAKPDLRFDPGPGWHGEPVAMEPWSVSMAHALTMELRPTSSGGLGVYPEHAANLAWVGEQIRVGRGTGTVRGSADGDAVADAPAPGPGIATSPGAAAASPTVLNLFAHTGLTTLAGARAGAAVTHVDAARSVVAWARRNAELSGLADRPVRWIVDDVMEFVAREARRGRRYDGILLDPPSFGRAKQGRRALTWRLEDELPALLDACRVVATESAFVLLSAHSEGLDGGGLAAMLERAFSARRGNVETVPLTLQAASGASLELGWAVRLAR